MSKHEPTVACFGETIWDSMPHGLFVGGAPYNVAYHLAQLRLNVLLVSSVGNDELGRLAIDKARDSGIDVSCVQISETLSTGISDVQIDSDGNASYRIRKPAAWDDITLTRLLKEKIDSCSAIVYGSLASRASVSRATLAEILQDFKGLKICDLNLREGVDLAAAKQLAKQAGILKLNEDELYALSGKSSSDIALEPAMEQVYEATGVSMLFVTRGSKPAAFYDGTRSLFAAPPMSGEVVDTVGAGDAFCAAITRGLLRDIPIEDCLDQGVRLGSYVATKQGAQPRYKPEDVFSPSEQQPSGW